MLRSTSYLLLGTIAAPLGQAQEEVGFDIRHFVQPLALTDLLLWFGLATAFAVVWTFFPQVFAQILKSNPRARYWWPTLMLGWAWLTMVLASHGAGHARSSLVEIVNFGFFLFNLPVLVVVGAIGSGLEVIGGIYSTPTWVLGLVFWATWYLAVKYLQECEWSSDPLSLDAKEPPSR